MPPTNPPVPVMPLPAFSGPATPFNAVPQISDTNIVAENGEPDTSADLLNSPVKLKMYEAIFNVQDKDYAIAIPKLEEVIKEDASLLLAWEALGWSYWATDRKEDARKLWERLQTLAPNEPLSYNCLAMVAAEAGDMAKAAARYRQSLELSPNQYAIWLAYYQTLIWLGNLDDAIPGLRDLLKQDPDRLDVRLQLATALLAHQDFEEALPHWTFICQQAPENVAYGLSLAQNLLYIGDLEMAAEEGQHVLKMDKDNVKALTLMADIAEFSRKPAEAVKELRKLVDRTENKAIKSQLLRRMVLLLRDLSAANPKDYPLPKTIAVAREAVDCDPRNVSMRLFLGELLIMDRQYFYAKELFENVLKDSNRDNLRAKNGILEIALARGQVDEAEQRLKDVLARFNPYDPYRYYQMARLEYARGNYYDALLMLNRLEEEGARGAVLVLLYHGLSPSEWTPMMSARRFREHIQALQRAGFKVIAPDQIPAYFNARQNPSRDDTRPVLNRMWRWIKYSFTGEDKPKPSSLREYHPEKIACVTFDDALRSSLLFGTPIAEEMGVQFGMNIPLGNILRHDIYIASWDELRRHAETGVWVYGSHLIDAGLPAAVDEQGYLVNPLPNRLWDPARNRPETLRAYFDRIRREFKTSREIIIKELGLEKQDCRFVAYPFGDIGQEVDCNVPNMDNICETLLNEAHLNYDLGFIQSGFGYALKGDNPLVYQRYEPARHESGQDVVQRAFENHPVFLARRMRAEIAALNGKLYLAQDTLKELERDGYPDVPLNTLSTYVKEHLAGTYAAPFTEEVERRKKQRWISLSEPYVGAEVDSTRANIQLEKWYALGRAGININPRLTIEANASYGNIRQEIISNNWMSVETTKVTVVRQRTETTDGSDTVSDTTITTYDPVTISTNIVTKRKYKSTERNVGGRSGYRFSNGSLLSLGAILREFSGSITNDEQQLGGSVEYQWKPVLALDAMARYEHDVIPARYRVVTYDAGALAGFWRVTDWWNIFGRGRYTALSDKNAFLNLDFDNNWLIAERAGIYLGLLGSFITADKYNPDYWTPYWQQRYYVYSKIQRAYPRFYGDAQVRVGQYRDRARDEDIQAYQDRKTRGEKEGWYPGPDPDQGFQPAVGVSVTWRAKWGRFLEFFFVGSVDALPNYTEHNIQGGLTSTF
ncbi:MAG: tetratricopeptide repeat protein [Lentisphaerae bacterium]|nr:tetratricopeptide repeat protein [Lentisphaerota bacterium]